VNKGVIVKVLPEDEMPRDSKGQIFDIIINPQGVPSRKNSGQLLELYTGRVVHIVNQQIQNLIKNKKYTQALNSIINMHKLMLEDTVYKQKLIENLTKLKAKANEDKLEKFMIYISKNSAPLFVDPVQGLNIQRIIKAMIQYGIKPKEKIYDPSIGGMTKTPVTFGYMYWEKTIHMAAKKLSARSIGPVQTATKQAKKVSGESGQRIDELSIHTLLSYGVYNYLTEISTLSSDDMDSKYEAIQKIYRDGKIKLIDLKGVKSTTSTQLNTILIAMGVVDPSEANK